LYYRTYGYVFLTHSGEEEEERTIILFMFTGHFRLLVAWCWVLLEMY